MMTVKELSELTGISARTLHYYDEIGLFPPTDKGENGYRLYDDKALEKLQQIFTGKIRSDSGWMNNTERVRQSFSRRR